MDLDIIKSQIGENEVSYGNISASELTNIYPYVHVSLEIDKKNLDYFYEIDVNELINSDISIDELVLMRNQGWAFNESGEKIILFLKT